MFKDVKGALPSLNLMEIGRMFGRMLLSRINEFVRWIYGTMNLLRYQLLLMVHCVNRCINRMCSYLFKRRDVYRELLYSFLLIEISSRRAVDILGDMSGDGLAVRLAQCGNEKRMYYWDRCSIFLRIDT